jgi:hypothetical protein
MGVMMAASCISENLRGMGSDIMPRTGSSSRGLVVEVFLLCAFVGLVVWSIVDLLH